MVRVCLVVVVVFLLACTGLTEWAEFVEEGPNGEHITERADGFDVDLPNGNGVHVYWGDQITHPRQIPLPPPPDSALVSWAEADLPMLQPAFLAAYGSLTPQKELVSFYRDAFKERDISFERQKDAETGSIALYGKNGKSYAIAVVHPDGAIFLGAGPRQAVDLGLAYTGKNQERNPRAWKGSKAKAKGKGKRKNR